MSKKKILVVDDEPFFVEVLGTRLMAEGFEVCKANNGEMAFHLAKKEIPDLIIMDVMMPLTSGYEAMQKIRQDPTTKHIPAIIFSGKAGMKDFFTGLPGVEFFHKPFDFKLLVARVEALIGCGAKPKPEKVRNAVLVGVEDLLVQKLRTFLVERHFQVFTALHEEDCIQLVKSVRPEMVLCQFWEDEHIMDPRKIAKDVIAQPSLSETRFYVYCREALGLAAMQHFKPDQILSYKETSDLMRKLEALIHK